MVGGIASSRWFRDDWRRRGIAAALIALFVIVALFPKQYRATTTMVPTDPASLGLGGALGQTSAFTSVFGNQAAIEIGLLVGRGQQVREIVATKLDMVGKYGFSNSAEADRWLRGNIGLRALRGGMLQVEVKNSDPDFALAIIRAYTEATRTRLAEISRSQSEYKQEVLQKLLLRATARLALARANYDSYRLSSGYAAPQAGLGGLAGRVPYLRQTLKNKEIDLETARAFATEDNMSVRQLRIEMDVLRSQLREAESRDASQPYAVNRVVVDSTKVTKLERELSLAQSQYDNYKFYLEGVSVEVLTSTGNLRILEPPTIDTARQFKTIPAGIALLIFLLALGVEFYLFRPPVSAARERSLQER